MVHYLVLGAGMQGVAGAYDLIVHGGASRVDLVDADGARLETALARLRKLTGFGALHGHVADAASEAGLGRLAALAAPAAMCFNALPYRFSEAITELALATRTSLVDLGGNTAIVRRQQKAAERHPHGAALCILPDCGLAPGMGNLFAAYALDELGPCRSIQVRCGGLPQNPRPPLDYMLLFSVEGLTNEYFGLAQVLRGGKRVDLPTFSELEEIAFDGLPPCEAFVTSGGLSTLPWTFEGRVQDLQYKTVRYRGHHAKFELLLDLGLLDETPRAVGGAQVAPRQLLHALLREKLAFPGEADLAVLRCTAESADGKQRLELEVQDRLDPATGFTAMERTTAFSAAACAQAIAIGRAKPGEHCLEQSVDARWFVEALGQRGIAVRVRRG